MEPNDQVGPIFDRRINLFVLAAVLGMACVAVALHRALPRISLSERLWVYGSLLAPVFLVSTRFLLGSRLKTLKTPHVLLSAAVLFGLALRLHAFFMFRGTPLDPDAQTYRAQAAAKSLGHFWDPNTWAPVHAYLVRIWFFLFGESDGTQRSLTLALSLIMILLTFVVGQRLFGNLTATSASILVAFSPTLLVNAARGLREEIVVLEVLLFLWILMRPHQNLWTAAGLGLLLGLVALTRMELLLPLGFGLLLKSLRSRPINLSGLAVSVMLALGLLVPQMFLLQKTYGDVGHWTKIFTRGYINIEYSSGNLSRNAFERSTTRPELLPSRREIRSHLFEGPPTSPATWYFRVHDPQTFIERTVIGTGLIPLSATKEAVFPSLDVALEGKPVILPAYMSAVAGAAAVLVTVLAIAGLVLTLLRGRAEIILILFAASALYAFPFTIGTITRELTPQAFDIRIVEFLMPMMFVAAGGALQLVVMKTRGLQRQVSEVH